MMKSFLRKKEIKRLKYLSTVDKDKIGAKRNNREEIEFLAKFILRFNHEDNFIKIEEE